MVIEISDDAAKVLAWFLHGDLEGEYVYAREYVWQELRTKLSLDLLPPLDMGEEPEPIVYVQRSES
jgi:hypothetical protein